MSERRLIYNAQGDEEIVAPKEGTVFVDKKEHVLDEEAVIKHWVENERIRNEAAVGQKEATVEVNPQYPDLPLFTWLVTDPHQGSCRVDYVRFWRDYELVKNTPNFGAVTNGDDIDNFSRAFIPDAVKEDPLPPDIQARLFVNRMKVLDDAGKYICASYGNHNDALQRVGLNWESTWFRDFKCPYFSSGGMLHIKNGTQEYKLAMTHKFWGESKVNPTNACKRFMEQIWPSADIAFIGHYHQAEFLFFRRDHERDYRYAVMGGTYKTNDEWAAKEGVGGRGGQGGFVLELNPKKRDITVWKSVEEAVSYFNLLRELKAH